MIIRLKPSTNRIIRHEYSFKQWDKLCRRAAKFNVQVRFRGLMFEDDESLGYAGVPPWTRLYRVPDGVPSEVVFSPVGKYRCRQNELLYFRSVPIRSAYNAKPKLHVGVKK